MAGNCILIQMCLLYVNRQKCSNEGGFSFHDSHSLFNLADLPFIGDLDCPSDSHDNILYVFFGISIYVFTGVSIILPSILYHRHRPVLETKLFE